MIDAAVVESGTLDDVRAARTLTAALTAFADELEQMAAGTLAANKRGAKGKAAIYTEGAALLRGRAAELETHGPISEADAKRRAALAETERLAAEARDDANTRPTPADIAALNEFVQFVHEHAGAGVENTALKVEQSSESATCGIMDELGYICDRPPHEPGTGPHEVHRPDGTTSVTWPDDRPAPTQSDLAAFLRGDTDVMPDLGSATVVDLGPASSEVRELIAAATVANPTLGHPVSPDALTEVLAMNPDPFTVAVAAERDDDPFAVATASSGRPPWRLDPEPVSFAFSPSTSIGVPDHVSYSQITTGEACGLQLRIKKRDGVKGQPAYYSVGGSSFHACVEAIERYRLGLEERMTFAGLLGRVMSGDLAACAELFVSQFDIAIAEAEADSGIPRERWKVAAQGTEGDTWWRHNGALMVRDYVAWAEARIAEGWAILNVTGKTLGIELELNEPIGRDLELNRIVNLNARLDQVWYRWEAADPTDADPTPILNLHIEDGKSGAKVSGDTFQLGLYGHVLARMIAREFPPPVAAKARLTASYYDARNGKSTESISPLEAHEWAEIEYRALTTLGMHAAGIYPANPNAAFGGPCGLCDVRHACPIMATRE